MSTDCSCQQNESTENNDQTLYSEPSQTATFQSPQEVRVPQQPVNPNVYYRNPQQPMMVQQQPIIQPLYVQQPLQDPVQEGLICGMTIPILDTTTAVVLLIINVIFLPGLGTMLVSCLSPNNPKCSWISLGLGQLITTFCCVGWIWSIVTSVQIMQKANQMQNTRMQQTVIGRPVIPVGIPPSGVPVTAPNTSIN